MKLFQAWAIGFAATACCTQTAQADLVISGATRSVVATATGPMGPVGGSDSSMATGLYSHTVMGDGMGPAGSIHAHASQSSTTPLAVGPSLGGIGAAGGSTTPASGMTGWSLTGDSFFDVVFTVSLDSPYLLDSDVSWTGPAPPMGGVAFLTLEELVPMALPLTLASVSKGPGAPGSASLTTTLPLMMGKTYHLRAVAHVDGGSGMGGSFAASASYEFTLSAIPETSAWLLTAPIAIGLALAAWRRRAHPPLAA